MPLFLVPCILSLLACSNLGSIHGKVLNKLSGKPAEGVKVSLSGTTTTATTGKDGSYTIPDVAPGPQKVVVGEPNLLTLDNLQLTVGERQKMEASDLLVATRPPAEGIFGYDSERDQYATLIARTATPMAASAFSFGFFLDVPTVSSAPSATSPVHLVTYSAPLSAEEAAIKRAFVGQSNLSLMVIPLVEQSASASGFQRLPERWELRLDASSTFEAAEVGAGLATSDIPLAPGAYCVRVGASPLYIGSQDCAAFRVVEKQDQAWVQNAPVQEEGGD